MQPILREAMNNTTKYFYPLFNMHNSHKHSFTFGVSSPILLAAMFPVKGNYEKASSNLRSNNPKCLSQVADGILITQQYSKLRSACALGSRGATANGISMPHCPCENFIRATSGLRPHFCYLHERRVGFLQIPAAS